MELKIGDLVTSYWEGYYEILHIDKDYYKNDKLHYKDVLVTVVQIYDKNGKARLSNTHKKCNSSVCRPAKQEILKSIEELKQHIINLENINKSI